MHDEKHLSHYLVLFTGLGLCLILFVLFRYNQTSQLVIAALTSAFYIFWGIIHHVLENRLSKYVIIEYVMFGLVAFILLFTAFSV